MSQINVDNKVSIPNANSIPMRRVDVALEDFDNKMHFSDRIGTEPHRYNQPWMKSDTQTFKFYSNFESNVVEVISCIDGSVVQTPSVSKLKTHTGLYLYSDCTLGTIGEDLFIYFTSGNTYTDANFNTIVNTFDLSGRRPNTHIKVGDTVRVQTVGLTLTSATITEIKWVPDLQAYGYLTDLDFGIISQPLGGLVEILYNEKDFDLYGFPIDFSGLDDGTYYIKITNTTSNQEITFNSEPIYSAAEQTNTLKIKYRHDGSFNFDEEHGFPYEVGEYNILRIPAEFYRIELSGEINQYEDDGGRLTQQRAVQYRSIRLQNTGLTHTPYWMIEKIGQLLKHETKEIYGKKWQQEDFGDVEGVDFTDLASFSVLLRQVDDVRFNEHTLSSTLNASFSPASHSPVTEDGAAVQSTLSADVAGTFTIVASSLPAWITVDENTRSDGEIVIFTVAENTGNTQRSATVKYKSDQYATLQAEVSITQDGQPQVGEYLEVESNSITLSPDGEIIDINVNASGTWTITGDDGEFSLINNGTSLRIANGKNTSGSTKTDTIVLELDSNNSITQSITISQASQDNTGLLSASPTSITNISQLGGTVSVTVSADSGTPTWGISYPGANPTWASISPTSGVGAGTITISIDANSGAARSFDFTVQNVNNPNNFQTIGIQQNSGDDGTPQTPQQP